MSSTIVYEGAGRWSEYAGGYSDWARQVAAAKSATQVAVSSRPRPDRPPRPAPRPRRMGFKEKRELAELPGTIERLETEKHDLFARMASPTFYQTPADEIGRARTRLDGLEVEIHRAYARWAELESLAGAESASADD